MINGPGSNGDQPDTTGPGKSTAAPTISLPKGGGAIRGIDEKWSANPVTGTGSLTVPISTSPGRSGFGPQLAIGYDSGSGNGPFGMGWNLSLPTITRKTNKGIPRYRDAEESDIYILSGSEDLVPVHGGLAPRTMNGREYQVQRYRPRVEGLFAVIERWASRIDPADVCWRSISRDNSTTWYGGTSDSRITDPADPTRIFSWLICRSYDDKGNALVYDYVAENDEGIEPSLPNERNRVRTANRYLKRLRYGNRRPNRDTNWRATDPSQLPDDTWMFEVVFDYGEHDADAPSPHEVGGKWPLRKDPFSSYRSGFEIRTQRLCQRVLMFHHFPNEAGVGANCLVRSTDLGYSDERQANDLSSPVFCSLISVTQSGYKRNSLGSYLKKSLPPVEFEYTLPTISAEVHELDAASRENLPHGVDGGNYQWVDLDGEGLAGILTEQADGWFYKRNLSPISATLLDNDETVTARFGPIELLRTKPSLTGRSPHFMDLAGDGRLDRVELDGPVRGIHERTDDEDWDLFRSFTSWPNIDAHDPNLRFVDLTGDGLADILISDNEAFIWHNSRATDGFGPQQHVAQAPDEEKGPDLVFADSTSSIFLADFSGDGLTDLARVGNGEVCYWPNLGYGRFGAKVTMDNAPRFDNPDQFDRGRIRLADIDGSGTTDIIYLSRDGVRLFFNEHGNSWTEGHRLDRFPLTDSLSSVTTTDLLGNGTACLVWSSPLPDDAHRTMRYVELMSGQKPHLLVKTVNNLGAETHMHYAPSTKFYLADKLAGRPWVTKLPFPVHVVDRIETYDRISGNRFVTRYAYHHGYFDGVEREFRGFGMVEQFDTEEFAALNASQHFPTGTNVDEVSHVPPTLTRTWFNTGAYLGRKHIADYFAGEYYRERGSSDEQAKQQLLDDTLLPRDLTVDEEREACRALRGVMLRQEIYALDGRSEPGYPYGHPYTVTEQSFSVECLQHRGADRHGVFMVHHRESINSHYERTRDDPRISHALTLEVDEFGNVLKSAAVAYGRHEADPELPPRDQAKQAQLLITYSEDAFTNHIEANDDYRVPLPSESRVYELTGLAVHTGANRLTTAEIMAAGTSSTPIAYEQIPTAATLEKRLTEHSRTSYRSNDLTTALPVGTLESMALPLENYRLAFTPGLVGQIYGGRVSDTVLDNDGRYVHSEGDLNWWIPSGRIFLSPGSADTPAQELAYAREHFFQPHRYRDPFHTNTVPTECFVTYDSYALLITETLDPVGNRVTTGERDSDGILTTTGNDYRTLAAVFTMDANRNRTAVALDALGMVVGTAVMGKPEDNPRRGDLLDDFAPDLDEAVILDHLANPLTDADHLLRRATNRLVYDLFAFYRTRTQAHPQPTAIYTLRREMHDADLAPAQQTEIQHSFAYSDGFGREIQRKIQAEQGPVPMRDNNGNIIIDAGGQPEMTTNDVSPRWVGTGWTVFNNKGKPVRKYEPFFTDSHHFESDTRIGVSPVLFYDPVGRVIATLHPNHTFQKVIFDPWRQETYDVNDTTLVADPKTDPDVGEYFRRLPDSEYLPTWHAQRQGGNLGPEEQDAAVKAAAHADTPALARFDSLGRVFMTLGDNGSGGKNESRSELDIEGNHRVVIDALDRVVIRYDYDMLGTGVHQASMDGGERWMLNDAAGSSLHAWDSRDHRYRFNCDQLHRPVESYLQTGTGSEVLVGRTRYGESQPNAETLNLRGRKHQVFDQAGIVTSEEYDFKGNVLRGRRELLSDYRTQVDWQQNPAADDGTFATRTTYDALNRPVTLATPDNTVIQPGYNKANLLDRIEANVHGAPAITVFVADIDYDAKGAREQVEYGNGVRTAYSYDPVTKRLARIQTLRGTQVLQDFRYTYDPIGNITHIRDDAQQTVFFSNAVVEPHGDYTYDALYRLIRAEGREHRGQSGQPQQASWNDEFRLQLPHPNDGPAMRRYTELYQYDAVGNILALVHQAANGNWSRAYSYNEPSLVEVGEVNNRLTSATVGTTTETYTYDAHGNTTSMPHLPDMEWDFANQLRRVDLGGGGTAHYVYDATGQRVRKVLERQNGTRQNERIYLGAFEVYRQYAGANPAVALERTTLHIMDEQQRVALVETRTVDASGSDPAPPELIRFQFGNQLGSSCLELDDQGQVISYEEYAPYGTSTYQGVRSQTETPKRYRYTGLERDEETGLAYHSARYYAPWLGRWTSTDPLGLVDGVNLYAFSRNSPINLRDVSGTDPTGTLVEYSDKGIGAGSKVHQLHFFPASIQQKINPGWNRALSAKYKELTYVGSASLNATIDAKIRKYAANIDNIRDEKHLLEIIHDIKDIWREAGVPADIVDKLSLSAFSTARKIGILKKPVPVGPSVFRRRPGGEASSAVKAETGLLGKAGKVAKVLVIAQGLLAAKDAAAYAWNGEWGKAGGVIVDFAYDQTIGTVVDAASTVKDAAEWISDPLAGVRETIADMKRIQDENDALLEQMLGGGDDQPAQPPPPAAPYRPPPQKPSRGNAAQSLLLWYVVIGLAASAPKTPPARAEETSAGETQHQGGGGGYQPPPMWMRPECALWNPIGIPPTPPYCVPPGI
jgi:RHS repeat-associated protein